MANSKFSKLPKFKIPAFINDLLKIEKIQLYKITTMTLGILFLASAGAGGYYYFELNKIQENSQKLAQEDRATLLAQIGRLILLPNNEDPTIATVANPELLRNQQFFNNAQKGDRILIYTIARKAILYNPTADKIIEVAPVNISPTQATTSVLEAPNSKASKSARK